MRKFFIYFFACFLLVDFSAFLFSSPKKKYKNWLNEEVYWLITKEEKKAFKKLKTDEEKDKFIALFWAKRDPTPLDEKNEFKEAYYERLNYVNLKFTRGPLMGWKTDIGKIMIFFGPPKERQASPETWFYGPIHYLGLDEEFRVVFDNRFSLDPHLTSKAVLKAIDNFAQKAILHPDLKEVPQYEEDRP